MKAKSIKRVAVALRLSFASHRDILHGISCYAKAHHWQLEFVSVPDTYAHEKLEMRGSAEINGVISCERPVRIIDAMRPGKKIPLAIISPHFRISHEQMYPVAQIRIDGFGIGSCAAKYLMSLGRFKSFGFVPETHRGPKAVSPVLRGFKKHLETKSIPIDVYAPEDSPVAGSDQDIAALTKWLAGLPKPAAVMAIYDMRATHVLTAAQKGGVAVPKEISVIGVDNDELLCDFTSPSLTSVAIDFVRAGMLAAQSLDGMMRKGKRAKSFVKAVDGRPRIVERESTAHLAPAVSLVERAMSYIRKNALTEINVTDVVEHLGVSRRLADRRFREIEKSSIMETIISIRLNEVKSRLASTRLPIGLITQACGFKNDNYAKNLFRRRFGMSMREWRKYVIKEPE